jgi:phosphoenolpyruvate carboxykinase (ATP)
MPIAMSRAIVSAALSGKLGGMPCRKDRLFGFEVPESIPGMEAAHCDQRTSWSRPEAYDDQAKKLAALFTANFSKYAGPIADGARRFGPMM